MGRSSETPIAPRWIDVSLGRKAGIGTVVVNQHVHRQGFRPLAEHLPARHVYAHHQGPSRGFRAGEALMIRAVPLCQLGVF